MVIGRTKEIIETNLARNFTSILLGNLVFYYLLEKLLMKTVFFCFAAFRKLVPCRCLICILYTFIGAKVNHTIV